MILELLISIILSIVAYIGVFFFVLGIAEEEFGSGRYRPLKSRVIQGGIAGLVIIACISYIYILSGGLFAGIAFGLPILLFILIQMFFKPPNQVKR